MNVVYNDLEYELIKDNKSAFDNDTVKELCTDYFIDFDYILGDYSYDKLRLKGFYDDNNAKSREINKISGIEDYIKNYCSFDCRHFILKKSNKK